jgi:hypothetical protein
MQIKPETQADYDKGLEVNQDPYGHRIYTCTPKSGQT